MPCPSRPHHAGFWSVAHRGETGAVVCTDESAARACRMLDACWLGQTVRGGWELVRCPALHLHAQPAQKTCAYRLPTEAEWEYAARAGSTGLRPFDRQALGEYAWYLDNSGDEPHPVATHKPNAWGLYDMFGNAWEWVADRYAPNDYSQSPTADPKGPAIGGQRVRRGDSY